VDPVGRSDAILEGGILRGGFAGRSAAARGREGPPVFRKSTPGPDRSGPNRIARALGELQEYEPRRYVGRRIPVVGKRRRLVRDCAASAASANRKQAGG